MKNLFAIAFYLLPFLSYTQSFQWIKDGGSSENLGSNDYEQVYSMATDSQKNVYVLSKVGMSSLNIDGNPKTNYDNPSSTPTDIVLASFSCNGTYRWSKIIGGANTENISAVQVDSQDNVYVAGKIASCDNGTSLQPYPGRIENDYVFSNASNACNVIFLAKFNTNGVFQYIKRPQLPTTTSNALTYTASFNFQIQNDILYWFVWLPPGTYANGAFTNSTSETHAPYVLKYNLDGTFIAATQLGAVQGLFDIIVKYYRNPYNGFYYMTFVKTGTTTFTINGQPVVNAAALVCYDANGNFLWKRENNNNNANYMKFFNLAFDPQNNIYIAGSMAGNNMNSFMGYFITLLNSPAFIMKLDATADNLLWASHHNTLVSSGYGALVYNGSEVAFTGWCGGTNFSWGSQSIYVTAPNELQDVLLARFNSATGACLSLNRIPSTIGSTDRGTALAVDASGDYLVGGGFAATIYDVNNNSVFNGGGTTDFFIAKFATQACQPLNSESFVETNIAIYPNPVQNIFTVPVKENTKYQLYTITGVLVQEGSVTTAENTISISELSSGCYVLKLQSESNKIETVKVIKE